MRTKNSIRNVISVTVAYFIIGVLGFIKAKVFVNNLSDDIYSLNQLFFQILSYLSLAEAGFGVYIVQQYYKAFSQKNYKKVNEIYETSVIFFRRLGCLILGLSLIVAIFVPLLTKANVTSTYIRIIFIVFAIKNCIDYFLSAPRNVIQADQKLYKINWLINAIRIIENIIEILLAFFKFDYLLILLPGIIIRIVFNIIINKKVYKEYPFLSRKKFKYNKEYLKGMSSLVYQKIAGLFYSNTDIILISTFVNPISVVIYSAYNYITKFIYDTIIVVSGAITPSYANVINKEENKQSFKIFNEMNIVFYFIACFFTITLYNILDPFVSLWMGNKYIIDRLGLILMLYIMFNSITRRMITAVVQSKGLFKETRNVTIYEALLNLIISLILVNFLGINGVLLGTVIATTLTTLWYIPYYIYKNVFNEKPIVYFQNYLFCLALCIVLSLALANIQIIKITSFVTWIFSSIYNCIIILFILFIIFYFAFKPFKQFLIRFREILNKKKVLK